jgi:tRNA (uracil-5-)-methyltransferase TRM9
MSAGGAAGPALLSRKSAPLGKRPRVQQPGGGGAGRGADEAGARPAFCEGAPAPQAASARLTPAIEVEHVRKVYDSIAEHWHGTRYKAWPRVQSFIAAHARGALFADLGCGNGKNAWHVEGGGGYALCCDTSLELLRVAGTAAGAASFESCAADIVSLPYRSGLFDCVLCIAVLHHISTEPRRVAALGECARLLRPGGLALIYAWALEQTEPPPFATQGGGGAEARAKAAVQVGEGRSGHRFEEPDVLVPWHLKRARGGGAAESKAERVPTALPGAAAAAVVTAVPGSAAAAVPAAVSSAAVPSAAPAAAAAAVPPPALARDSAHPAPGDLGFAAAHVRFDAYKDAFVFQRYCHVYREGELRGLVAQLGPCVEVVDEYWDTGNWALVLRRTSAA